MNQTYECPCCLEEYPYDQHLTCTQGHSAGCVRCHMALLKSHYASGQFAFQQDNAQKCFVCRTSVPQIWSGKKFTETQMRTQPIMVAQMIKKFHGVEKSVDEILQLTQHIQQDTSQHQNVWKIFKQFCEFVADKDDEHSKVWNAKDPFKQFGTFLTYTVAKTLMGTTKDNLDTLPTHPHYGFICAVLSDIEYLPELKDDLAEAITEICKMYNRYPRLTTE